MDFNVKGITFNKNELTTIKLDELAIGSISRSHLFFIPPTGKSAFLIIRAGDYIDSEVVEKYRGKGIVSFYQLEVAQEKGSKTYREFFLRMKQTRSEKERKLLKDELLETFIKDYWGQSHKSYLTFGLAIFEEFYDLPVDVLETYQSKSLLLYSRALISSSFVIVTCLMSGVVDMVFLKDIYNVCFLMDYGLLAGDFNYSLSLACEKERLSSGEGIVYLNDHSRSEEEQNLFLFHPDKSADIGVGLKERFANPELIDLIRFHHEKADGSGFPNGYYYSGLSDTETFLCFVDQMVPFKEQIFLPGDGQEIVKQAFESLRDSENRFSLPIKKSIANWQSKINWVTKARGDKQEIA